MKQWQCALLDAAMFTIISLASPEAVVLRFVPLNLLSELVVMRVNLLAL